MIESAAAQIPVTVVGLIASLAAGLMTAVGALPVLFVREISQSTQNILLGFGGGVMLAATAFSLILPGLSTAATLVGDQIVAAFIVAFGILTGGGALWLGDRWLPTTRSAEGPYGISSETLRRTWLFVAAITLHNLPEGLAIGVGFAAGEYSNGLTLAIGIGIQNIPEGLAVALALLKAGYSRGRSFLVGASSGLAEPLGGALGAGIVSVAAPFLPLGLAFAAGAMLFVISQEVIPEMHRESVRSINSFGLLIGFVIMMLLDVVFG